MFITVIRGRWLNTHHITEVNSQAEDGDSKRCTDIHMSNGDIVRLYPRKADFECFWTQWEAFLDQQAAAVKAGEFAQTRMLTTQPDIDERLAKALDALTGRS